MCGTETLGSDEAMRTRRRSRSGTRASIACSSTPSANRMRTVSTMCTSDLRLSVDGAASELDVGEVVGRQVKRRTASMRPTARQLCSAAPCARVARMSEISIMGSAPPFISSQTRRGGMQARCLHGETWRPMVSLHAQLTCQRMPQKSQAHAKIVPSQSRVHIKGPPRRRRGVPAAALLRCVTERRGRSR